MKVGDGAQYRLIEYTRNAALETKMPVMPLNAACLPRGVEFGVDDGKRTLWIFGAGASAHLGFPLSWGFLRKTVSLIAERFKGPSLKKDSVKAFDNIDSWSAELERPDYVRLQYLINHLKELKGCLARLGITPDTNALLDTEPEKLIQEIRTLTPAGVQNRTTNGRNIRTIQLEIDKALECVRLI